MPEKVDGLTVIEGQYPKGPKVLRCINRAKLAPHSAGLVCPAETRRRIGVGFRRLARSAKARAKRWRDLTPMKLTWTHRVGSLRLMTSTSLRNPTLRERMYLITMTHGERQTNDANAPTYPVCQRCLPPCHLD